ncbi:MAG: SUMF1/EgtB/PvdO family nonheme iron enzyme [Planctomycetota bacterium]|nr:SUMF1/EgtB/PvdO family nonheme iron enzyme [Planctomycetota bacterium]
MPMRPWSNWLAITLAALFLIALAAPGAVAAAPTVGFMAAAAAPDKLGPESRAAWELATKLSGANLILVPSDGKFVDEKGQDMPLEQFHVLWYHEGDTSGQTPVHGARSFPMLRKHVSDGGRLFLSGAALAVVHTMGIEPAQPRRGPSAKDNFFAQLIPVEKEHPIFRGLSCGAIDEGLIPIASAGLPAYADFLGSGGPTTGMLLGRANYAAENPLVEYQLGKGRVIVLGWRFPYYSHAENAHRANLEQLTGNILAYLGDEKQWQKIVVKPHAAPQATKPGNSDKDWKSLELAIRDLVETFSDRYPKGGEYLNRLASLKASRDEVASGKDAGAAARLAKVAEEFAKLRADALLDNPLLGFARLLVIERGAGNLGLPVNWDSNTSLGLSGFENRLCVLSPVRPEGTLATLYQPTGGRFVGDVDLHPNADRLLFSMPGSNGRWQVHELKLDGLKPAAQPSDLRELALIREPDVDNYDACYLPDGRIIFCSTAPYVGVPCVYGASYVTNLYLAERDGSIRQITVDQEHNWCPTVLNNGRVLYLRWEYTDLPHAHSRRLFQMNPDGTAQMEYMSSNSYFPNAFFYARPIPGHPTKVVGIATGHHGNSRTGRLLIIDPAQGRHEADGVVQEIPGYGKKVDAIIRDQLADGFWPQFLHPYPLSDPSTGLEAGKYFLVSAKPGPNAAWGIYLVDVFDNMLLIKESPEYALLEPIPLQKTPVPPVVVDRVDLKRKDALVYMIDVYEGAGLKGIPRGTVKRLRLFTYHFSYRGMGGLLGTIGMDGPWDIKRVLGTVPVEADGSAVFRVPANTPIAVQPLDAEGKALQLMRSWFTAMPGETLSCVGCHEQQNVGPPNRQILAGRRPPSEIEPWHGPVRGFAFHREVQPVLDAYCVGCHNGQPRPEGASIADLRGSEKITDWNSDISGHVDRSVGGKFSVAYAELHRFVRRPGIESDIHLLAPMEFHADATELVQILRKGHYGVKLDAEALDRITTWIDLNTPYHGTWTEIAGEAAVRPVAARKRELLKRYAGVDDDPEAILAAARFAPPHLPVVLQAPADTQPSTCPGWPFDAAEARRRQGPNEQAQRTIDLDETTKLELVRIPAGEFIMGDPNGPPDEQPASRVTIAKPFWMGRYEVTNEQFARFDPQHDSHVEPMHGYQFGVHGYPLNRPKQPAVRLSWNQAMDFCRWLSRKTGHKLALPTEAQWEWACRAGAATPFFYGDLNTDFSKYANLGDAKLREFALDTYVDVRVVPKPNKYDDWVPKDDRFNDGSFVSADLGLYQPNAWGLQDMHGNVWEWTRSVYRPYPCREDGWNEPSVEGRRVVRGGSWYDRPKRGTSSFRLAYVPYQPVFNVGFRVILEEE